MVLSDENKINDMSYMKYYLINKRCNHINELGEELLSNKEYILRLVSEAKAQPGYVYRYISESLRNDKDFLVEFIKVCSFNVDSFKSFLYKYVDKRLTVDNKEFWDAAKAKGFLFKLESYKDYRYSGSKIEIAKKRLLTEEIKDEPISRIAYITPVKIRDDEDFMFELIKLKPESFEICADVLKRNENFIKKLQTLNNNELNHIIENYMKEKCIDFSQKEEKTKEKHDKEKQDKEKQDKEKHRRMSKKKAYKLLGYNHPNIVLLKKYFAAKEIPEIFCNNNNISFDQFNEILEDIKIYFPKLEEAMKLKEVQIRKIKNVKANIASKKIINKENGILEYAKNDNILILNDVLNNMDDEDNKKIIYNMLLNDMLSDKISIEEYIKLFSYNNNVFFCLRNIKNIIYNFNMSAEEKADIAKKIEIIKRYIEKYNRRQLLNMRIFNGHEMVDVLEENVDLAEKYLKNNNKFVCQHSMFVALTDVIKGKITEKDIIKEYIEEER